MRRCSPASWDTTCASTSSADHRMPRLLPVCPCTARRRSCATSSNRPRRHLSRARSCRWRIFASSGGCSSPAAACSSRRAWRTCRASITRLGGRSTSPLGRRSSRKASPNSASRRRARRCSKRPFGTADYLVPGAEFDWPHAPRPDGGTADLRRSSGAPASSAYTAHLMDLAAGDVVFRRIFAAGSARFRLRLAPQDFPWLGHLGGKRQPSSGPLERRDPHARDGVRRLSLPRDAS